MGEGPTADARTLGLLRLTLVDGLGPVRIARLMEAFGSPDAVLAASPSALARVKGIGPQTADRIARGVREADPQRELDRLHAAGARLVSIGGDGYPPLLAQTPGAPPLLSVRGEIRAHAEDRYTVAIVGSRSCTHYGLEQAERFGAALARAGITVVSGGARGIDSAAHRGAIAAGGRTIAVLGCGIARAYPPENSGLFEQIAAGHGAVVSELPADAPPDAQNFPARNRIISGLSLGVLVIEAAVGSGALITARHAIEDHGREVMVVPGRADSEASRGGHELVKRSEAALVTDPADVLALLESAARHQFDGTHAARTADPTRPPAGESDPSLFCADPSATNGGGPQAAGTNDRQRALLRLLAEAGGAGLSLDELARLCGMEPGPVRAELTMLELAGAVRRAGHRFVRTA